MKIYLGMVSLYNRNDEDSSEVISFAGFSKESVKHNLEKIADEVLETIEGSSQIDDPEDPESIMIICEGYPSRIRYWIKEVDVIDEGG